MINDIPRTVHVNIAETITVVPFLRFRKSRLQVIIRKKSLYFFICKTKLFIKPRIGNRQDLKII